jgi:hypothetical protein
LRSVRRRNNSIQGSIICEYRADVTKRFVMEIRNARHLGEALPTAAPGSEDGAAPTAAKVPPWYRRVGFWRAVAGMAVAVAIGCAAVAAEYSTALIGRTRNYHFRLHQLAANITTMRGEIASADREIAGMRTAAQLNDGLKKIIAEPDSRLIRLEAPGHAARPSGVIAFSAALRRAALAIDGLPALPNGGAYGLWWLGGKHALLKAAQIRPDSTDKAAIMIALPAGSETIEGAVIAADSIGSTARTWEEPVLKGMIAHGRARPAVSRRKGG